MNCMGMQNWHELNFKFMNCLLKLQKSYELLHEITKIIYCLMKLQKSYELLHEIKKSYELHHEITKTKKTVTVYCFMKL